MPLVAAQGRPKTPPVSGRGEKNADNLEKASINNLLS
jgi:hypothetical protein